jgi:hypothetical protein
MPALMNPFDASQYDPSQTASQLPIGRHPVIIESSSIETTQKGDSGMVVFGLRVIDGPAKGSTGAYRLNLYHSSAKTSEIAHRQLSALSHVTNVFRVNKTEDLHNIPFVVDVELQRDPEAASKGYTQVVRVYDMQGNEPGKAPQGGGMAQPQQQPQQQQPQAAWGQPQNGAPAPAPAPAAAWGGGAAAPQQQPAPAPAPAAAWGNGGGAAAPAPAAGGWAQNQPANGPAPWGQR